MAAKKAKVKVKVKSNGKSNGKFQPRKKYEFEKMKTGGTKAVEIPKGNVQVGIRALTAAYAFARRNKGTQFAGRTVQRFGKTFMEIHRVK